VLSEGERADPVADVPDAGCSSCRSRLVLTIEGSQAKSTVSSLCPSGEMCALDLLTEVDPRHFDSLVGRRKGESMMNEASRSLGHA